MTMYAKSARFYDAVYAWKDYAGEVAQLHALIQQVKQSPGANLLDVACGTGGHIPYLCKSYAVQGLDLDEDMLGIARERFPDIEFHRDDMVDFDLSQTFDVITCLFSAIGYVMTEVRLQQAIQNMANHLVSGGVLIVEPWLSPEMWKPGSLHGLNVEKSDLRISRMNINEVDGNISIVNFHYMVGTPDGIHYFTERHELGLFTTETYLDAFQRAGLDGIYDSEGLMGRGLFIGVRPTVS
jgi:SAM-dependent methyltransferase